MWYPAKTIVPVAEREPPVSLAEARAHLRVDYGDDDPSIDGYVAAAVQHVESYCGIRLAPRTIEAQCDGWGDLARGPLAPVQSVASIVYVDAEGAAQTLPAAAYEPPAADCLDAGIALAAGGAWPHIRAGSRITVTAVVGFAVLPPALRGALLLLIGDLYFERQPAKIEGATSVDNLLCNWRRGG